MNSLLSNFKSSLIKSADYQRYLTETQNLERDYITELLNSRQLAWRITTVCCAMVLLVLIVLGVLEHALAKPIPPFVLRVDKVTGETEVVSVMKEQTDSYGEIIDKYWLNLYLLNAESYNYHTIQHSYDLVGLLSSPEVAKHYQQRFSGTDALDKVLKDSGSILVNVHSIVPEQKNGMATIHFDTITTFPGQELHLKKNWIATISYQYKNAPMKESDRLNNPLGFQVTSYRIDPEDISVNESVPSTLNNNLGSGASS